MEYLVRNCRVGVICCIMNPCVLWTILFVCTNIVHVSFLAVFPRLNCSQPEVHTTSQGLKRSEIYIALMRAPQNVKNCCGGSNA